MFLGLQCDDPSLWPDRQWKDAYHGNWKHSRTFDGVDRHCSKGLRLHLWGTREQEKTVWVQSVLSQSAVLGNLWRWLTRLARLRSYWQGYWKEFKAVINSRREKRHDQNREFEKRTSERQDWMHPASQQGYFAQSDKRNTHERGIFKISCDFHNHHWTENRQGHP